MHPPLDIAVCGCGPAGLTAAIFLRRAGHQVRIFERFDTPQPVGSGLILQPTGLSVLDELGLLDRITTLGSRIDRLFGRVVPSNRVVLDVRYRALGSQRHGIAVHRATLFDVLHDAAVAEGIEIVPGTPITDIDNTGTCPVLLGLRGKPLGTFDLIVDALGANSALAPYIARRTALPYGALWANVPWPEGGPMLPNALEQRYHRATRMAGLLPIGRRTPGGPRLAAFFWSLRRDRFALWKAEGIAKWKAEVHQLWPQLAPVIESITEPSQLTFAQYDHFTAQTPYSDRVVHIGDSARATSPQLGQGANMAIVGCAGAPPRARRKPGSAGRLPRLRTDALLARKGIPVGQRDVHAVLSVRQPHPAVRAGLAGRAAIASTDWRLYPCTPASRPMMPPSRRAVRT